MLLHFSTLNLVLQISNVAEDTQPSFCILIKQCMFSLNWSGDW